MIESDSMHCDHVYEWKHIFDRHNAHRNPLKSPRLEPAYRVGFMMLGADDHLWVVRQDTALGKKWVRTTMVSGNVPEGERRQGLVTVDRNGRSWIDEPTGQLQKAASEMAHRVLSRMPVFETVNKKRNPTGSPREEPAYAEGHTKVGRDKNAWVVAPHKTLGKVWRRTERVATKPLTLSQLTQGVTRHVFFPYQKRGEFFTPRDATPMTPLHVELDSSRKMTMAEAAKKQKTLAGRAYVVYKEAPEMGLSICDGGRLANNCMTGETYVEVASS